MQKILAGQKLLISAGPVWVPIDRVRVITNIFGGNLGSIIAQKAYEMGADVELLMGPGRVLLPKNKPRFKVIKFKYYNDILHLMKSKISSNKYNIVIHSAAVSDYQPIKTVNAKIKSGKKSLTIKLKPTLKIVDLIKKIDPNVFLVTFKLEVDKSKNALINIAYKSLLRTHADLIVANDFNTVIKEHKAYIINKAKQVKTYFGKENIAKNLLLSISKNLY